MMPQLLSWCGGEGRTLPIVTHTRKHAMHALFGWLCALCVPRARWPQLQLRQVLQRPPGVAAPHSVMPRCAAQQTAYGRDSWAQVMLALLCPDLHPGHFPDRCGAATTHLQQD